MKTTKQVLIDARELIANPMHWTQHDFAKDADGKPVAMHTAIGGNAGGAVCWCSLGALIKVTAGELSPEFVNARFQLRRFMELDIARFNDTRTHAEVLAAFDKAIDNA